LRFWFRYVHPNRSLLELGLAEGILEHRSIPTFDAFVGMPSRKWQENTWLAGEDWQAFLPIRPHRSWWDRADEIDVVAINDDERELLTGECKWSTHPVGVPVLSDLQEKSTKITSTGDWAEVIHILFSRSVFTKELLERSRSEGKSF
jgi:uncharacterized protein